MEARTMIRLGDHVVVRGEDEEAIVTAVHPDSQVEIEYLHASAAGRRRKRYAAEALDPVKAEGDRRPE
jgi:cytidylate kinase